MKSEEVQKENKFQTTYIYYKNKLSGGNLLSVTYEYVQA